HSSLLRIAFLTATHSARGPRSKPPKNRSNPLAHYSTPARFRKLPGRNQIDSCGRGHIRYSTRTIPIERLSSSRKFPNSRSFCRERQRAGRRSVRVARSLYNMVRRASLLVMLVAALGAPAATASAQGAGGIAGTVRDTSGGVMPGVTVEASSPALIEKVRSVVSDAEGQYKIIDLLPGVYTVKFSLTGFSSVRREGIELSAGFTATINTELRVGELEESITVTGQSPLVDTQNVVQQKVITRELLDSVPSSRSNYSALTPGASKSTDVGGSNGTDAGSTFTIHGSRALDVRRLIDGMRWNSMEAANAGTGFYYDPTGAEEIAIQLGGNSAEFELGGVQVNLVPKSGSNNYNGYFYAGYTNNNLNSTAVPDDLKARGLPTIGAVDYVYDYSGSLGGPILKDKLWFFTAQRWWGNSS